MPFTKPSPVTKPSSVEWFDTYPAECIPDGLRHEEVRPERSADGTLQVPCRIYRWRIVVGRWNTRSLEWELSMATAFSHRRLDNGGEVHSGVHGSWNQALDRRLWRKWGPHAWCLVTLPDDPSGVARPSAPA